MFEESLKFEVPQGYKLLLLPYWFNILDIEKISTAVATMATD